MTTTYRDRNLLGRRIAVDPRDVRYPMRAATRKAGCLGGAVVPIVGKTWDIGPVLDQGSTSECVAYAWAGWLACRPVATLIPREWIHAIYRRAQQLDEWPGEDYDGTSVRAGAKVMGEQGRIEAYVWASSMDEVRRFIETTGPVVVGSDWTEGMFTPVDGYILPVGEIAGGHAYLLYGYSPTRKAFRMANSWGNGWAEGGSAWMREADVEKLLRADGEACAGAELTPALDPNAVGL